MCQYEKDPVRIAHNYRSQFWAYPPLSSSLSRVGALETVFRFPTSASPVRTDGHSTATFKFESLVVPTADVCAAHNNHIHAWRFRL